METGRITNAREHLRKINNAAYSKEVEHVYMHKKHQYKLAIVGMKQYSKNPNSRTKSLQRSPGSHKALICK